MEENKDLKEEEIVVEGNDTVKIANDAVATYAGIAVSEVNGVYEMAGGFNLGAISGKKNLTKGIKVDVNDKNVKIDVSIIVEYGARIPDVAYSIQSTYGVNNCCGWFYDVACTQYVEPDDVFMPGMSLYTKTSTR